jgi:phage anti-repressor protein
MNKTQAETIAEIKNEFLLLVREPQPGYFISLEKTYTWLENPKMYNNYVVDENARRNFRKRYLRGEKFMLDESTDEKDIDKDFIMRKNDKNINMPWFSIEGFKTFCMVVNEPKSNYVRKYFIQIEKDYMRVLEQSSKATYLELYDLNIDLSKAKTSIIKMSDTSDKYLEQKLILERKLKTVESLEIILDDQSDFATNGNNEYKEYLYLRETFMKKIPIYIVKPDSMIVNKSTKVVTPEQDDNESDIDFVSMLVKKPLKKTKSKKSSIKSPKLEVKTLAPYYEKEYNEYNFKNDILVDDMSGGDSPVLYYYIGGFMEKIEKNPDTYFKICDIFVLNKEHLSDIKIELNEVDSTTSSKKWIYKTTYTHINNIALGISSNKLCDLLVNKKNTCV